MWVVGALLVACAVSVSAITKGYTPKEEDVPWVVNIMFSNAQSTHHCGGVLISDFWVASAASCVRKNDDTVTVLLGAHSIGSPRQRLPVVRVITHEKFGWLSWKNDMALLRMQRAPTPSEFIKPIRLPSWTQAKKTTFKNWDTTTAGWGKDGSGLMLPVPIMNAIDLHVITNFNCWFSFPLYLDDTNICTQGKGVPCDADEGGPLWVYEDDNLPTLIGIISYVFDTFGCTSLYPAVYARVTEFLPWIEKHTDGEVHIRN